MNYLSVENLSKSYGDKMLFSNVSFGIEKGQKKALIARNGTGKSTLLNIINGNDLAEEGKVIFRKGIKVAYLPQNPPFDPEQSIMDFLFEAENESLLAARDYEMVLWKLEKEDSPELRKKLEEATFNMDRTAAWDYEGRLKEVLFRLQLLEVDKKMGLLSGGQQKKAALAKVLIEAVDLLILDEPTNHLDLVMTEWLEDFLSRQNLALLLVTHDRAFLDAVCSEIIELDKGQIYTYKGSYNYFLEKKAERESIERAELEKARNTYRHELDWMRRMPCARGTKAKARKEAFYDLKDFTSVSVKEEIPELSVQTERLGGKILEVYNLEKSYAGHKLIDDFSYTFKRGEKIGIVGANGIGKSTLLNMLTGKIKPDSGKVVIGQTVKFGYYQQNGLIGGEDRRVIDIIKEVAEVVKMENGSEISASQFLTYFQFDATTQYNYFSNLSGGERRRLYLLRTLMANPNFLILDEPTNDLDVFTLMLLEDFLAHYQGCLLMVSHDRSFMEGLADHLFIFEGDGKIKDYYGTYAQYKKALMDMQRIGQKEQRKERSEQRVVSPSNKPTYKQKKEYEEIGLRIENLEKQKKELESKLSDTASLDRDSVVKASQEIAQVLSELDLCENKWLALAELMGE
ncbi:MAG: ABC-F family ATP-binding cassette domain-containing protein [Bacteroidales bacterium]